MTMEGRLSMDRLAGRTAIVTGGGSGIGRAIAVRLAEDGCNIGIFDRNEQTAVETVAMVTALGRRGCAATGDVANRDEVRAGVVALRAALGPIDILVNNAGILRTSAFVDTTVDEWRTVLATNLDGVFHFCQAVLPNMIARGKGCVINMSSWTGKQGVANHAAYATSKFGVIGLSQSIAAEVAKDGVRVNAVCPGIIIETQMRDEAETLNREQGLPDVTTRVQSIPLRRAGYPKDVAGVVAFLASEDAAYMTGQAINITGGLWMH